MSQAPGYQKWPNHKIIEQPLTQRVRVEINGEVVADSGHAIRVDEDRHPTRYYFPRTDVHMDKLQRTETTSTCPFKGVAHYYTLALDGNVFTDAVWTYEDPYDEHRGLKDLLAFYDDKIPAISIRA